MDNIKTSLTQLIGNTPMLELKKVEEQENLHARIIAKIESFNPGGSVKDRIALSMIETAEKEGRLQPGATIIEPTSGNTGIGIAWISRVKGYRCILTMPETMSEERRKLLKAFGAELFLTPGKEGMKGAIAKAVQLQETIPHSIILGQFSNPANPIAHYLNTGEEIWRDTAGKVDIFVAGVGTGGTISGCAKALRAHKKDIEIVAVEPATSPVLSGGTPGPHKIQGIGAGFVPENYDKTLIDEVFQVTEKEAVEAARLLAKNEGLLAGISSGAALAVALRIARKPENEGKAIVVLMPDTGERYLSTDLFEEPIQLNML